MHARAWSALERHDVPLLVGPHTCGCSIGVLGPRVTVGVHVYTKSVKSTVVLVLKNAVHVPTFRLI